jgi:hypothetical protein
MSAGNDDVALDDVLNSLRNADPDLAKVLHNNAVIVGVNGAINWGPSNHLPWADFDFIVATNPEAVRGTWSDGTPLAGNPPGGTSFAAPFVLGLVSRKAESLKDPNNPALAAVADAEALCMVKTAAKNRGWLADGDYVNITERCCLDRPAGERDDKVHCCRPGQTWNADTGACGAACAILDQSLTDLEFGTYAPHMSYSAAITIVNSGDESASVTVNSDSTGSDGSPPPFMVANTLADPSTKTVSAGGSATFTVTFTAPEIPNEYDATISFGVTGTQCSAAIRSVHVHASVISITPP